MRFAASFALLPPTLLSAIVAALPLEPRASFSVVNVDGSSASTVEATTVVQTVTASATPSQQTVVTTQSADSASLATETVVSTVVMSNAAAASTDVVTSTAPAAPPVPSSNISSTSSSSSSSSESSTPSTMVLSFTTTESASTVTDVVTATTATTSYYDDGMWHTSYIIKATPTDSPSPAATLATSANKWLNGTSATLAARAVAPTDPASRWSNNTAGAAAGYVRRSGYTQSVRAWNETTPASAAQYRRTAATPAVAWSNSTDSKYAPVIVPRAAATAAVAWSNSTDKYAPVIEARSIVPEAPSSTTPTPKPTLLHYIGNDKWETLYSLTATSGAAETPGPSDVAEATAPADTSAQEPLAKREAADIPVVSWEIKEEDE